MLKRFLLSGAALAALGSFAVAQTTIPAETNNAPNSTPAGQDIGANPGAMNNGAAPGSDSSAAPGSGMSAPSGMSASADQAAEDPNLFSNMQGVDIVGENDESVGSVADVLLSADGSIKNLVIGHGGLVGIGQTYRLYDAAKLPELQDGKVRLSGLNASQLEGLPEFDYAQTGRASTEGAASAPADAAQQQNQAATPDAWPASAIVGASLNNVEGDPEIQDLRFEGSRVAAVLIDGSAAASSNEAASSGTAGSASSGSAATTGAGSTNEPIELQFSDLQLSGTADAPEIGLKSATGGLTLKAGDNASSGSAGSGQMAPAAPAK